MLKTIILIAVGGALGAVMRFLSQATIYELVGRSFPFGTMFVNVTGSFLMGLLSIFLVEKFNLGAEWHMAILIGVLGSFTTFSTFSLETITLLENGQLAHAGAYVVMSAVLCVTMAGAGIWLARTLA